MGVLSLCAVLLALTCPTLPSEGVVAPRRRLSHRRWPCFALLMRPHENVRAYESASQAPLISSSPTQETPVARRNTIPHHDFSACTQNNPITRWSTTYCRVLTLSSAQQNNQYRLLPSSRINHNPCCAMSTMGKERAASHSLFPCPEYHQIFPSDIAAAGNIIHPPSNNSTRENNHATSPCAFRQQGWLSLSTSHRRHLTFITSKYP
jgi:hypothetical protein